MPFIFCQGKQGLCITTLTCAILNPNFSLPFFLDYHSIFCLLCFSPFGFSCKSHPYFGFFFIYNMKLERIEASISGLIT